VQIEAQVCLVYEVIAPMHRAFMHSAEVGHAWPQPPQFDASVCVSVHVEPHAIPPLQHAA
jgi:hypothetical protein